MENYTKIQQCFEENKCTLITTFEDFEKLRITAHKMYYQYVRVRFIALCMHESSVIFTNFFLRKTGIICKECTVQKSKVKNNIDLNKIEYNGIKIIEEYLYTLYDIVRTKEGCKADLAIKLKNDDKWIPVQIKVTDNICHGMYSFTLKNDYTDMLLMCICVTERKIWIIPFNDVNLQHKINISIKSKYNKYLIDNNDIHHHITQYIDKIQLLDLDTILLPINKLQQREQEYIKKRENYVPFLNYIYPDIQGTVVDVICNGINIQEKVLGYDIVRKRFHTCLCSHNGNINGKRQFRMYKLGENKYYWLHSSIDNRFWIIPEEILEKYGYISKADEIKNRKSLYFKPDNSTHIWLNDFEHTYDNVDKNRIISLFE